MAKKHFMCTHTFLEDEAKKMFEDASLDMTDRDMFAAVKTEKAEMLGHWRGEEDFFFCHWYAESEDDILENLEKVGFNSLMNTLPNEMFLYGGPVRRPGRSRRQRQHLLQRTRTDPHRHARPSPPHQ